MLGAIKTTYAIFATWARRLAMLVGAALLTWTTSSSSATGDCWSGAELNGELCYPKCKAGYKGVGPVCWQHCKAGYKDDGATCRKDVIIQSRPSYGRGAGKPMGCGSNKEKDGALCYPKCKDGYNGVGPVCWERCKSGYKDDGAACRRDAKIIGSDNSKCPWHDKCGLVTAKGCSKCPAGYKNDGCTCRRDVHIYGKKSYGRGAGSPLNSCASNEEKDGALCYPKCKAGYDGVGPVCWANCPAGFKNDGATCRKDAHIYGKHSYGRGAGFMKRGAYRNLFKNFIKDNHNFYALRAKPLTASEKTYLKQWFPEAVLNKVRVAEDLAQTGFFIFSASATTYGTVIVVKTGKRTNSLLRHEMVHVCQYEKFGKDGFATRYADQYVDSGYDYNKMPFEEDAFDFQGSSSAPVIGSYNGKHGTSNSWYSACK